MMDEHNQDLDEITPETGADAPEAPEAMGDAAEDTTATGQPAEEASGEGEAPARPREVIRGIHPELKCECPECAPDFTELQWFSPEEEKKTKGQVMLYCQRSSRKYFSPAAEFQAWFAENKAVGRKRRD